MDRLTRLIYEDMKPALGVTEPGAIAFAVATAKAHIQGKVDRVDLRLNSGMYKNAFTCGIPGSDQVGNLHAAALGAVGADPEKGLECLDGVTEAQREEAEKMVADGKIHVSMSRVSSNIEIEATVTTDQGCAVVLIRDAHTHIVEIRVNDRVVFRAEEATASAEKGHEGAEIHKYTLAQLVRYAETVPAEEIAFIEEAYRVNLALFEEGIASSKTTFAPFLLAKNGGKRISDDEEKTADLLCNAAIEARVIGLNKAAMSITGSGAHGIIATMPLYAAYKVQGYTKEQLLRATALSYLVCMYIKEYSGKLSAFCGCAIAAGTGMAVALAWLRGGDLAALERVICNMASSITGMICDGGNQGCVMKGIAAVGVAYASVSMALEHVSIEPVHGINGRTPEDTMRYMGQIASPGMVGTEATIMDILQEKLEKSSGV
ncbi:MAG: L-serine ammonia-lyase, iron-sulfur-dependent, subunit alpha [Christensenellales bacterium]|nr:L-serine ammonia-lyase, iron-sulfur-dependent, subunit alpha [Christensenellales bacterium]